MTAADAHKGYGYDNKCRSVSTDDARRRVERGFPATVRLRIPEGAIHVDDLVFGRVSIDCSQSAEGDPIIYKSDGLPTYHLATVVDDHLMGITHVLRGAEWQISTPKHVLLYRALGWRPPLFAHLPLLVDAESRKKLSKRDAMAAVEPLRRDGTVPEALLSLLYALVRHGDTTVDETRILSLDEMVSDFDIEQTSRMPGVLSENRLSEYNRAAIARRFESDPEALLDSLLKLVQTEFGVVPERDYVRHVLRVWRGSRLNALQQLVTPEFAFVWRSPTIQVLENVTPKQLRLVKEIAAKSFSTPDSFVEAIQEAIVDARQARRTVSKKDAMKLIRLVLTDYRTGPPIAEIAEVVGVDRCRQRLAKFSSTPDSNNVEINTPEFSHSAKN